MTPYDNRWDMAGQGSANEAPAAAAPPEVAKPAAPAHSKKKRSAKDVFLDLLGSVIPKAGDSAMEIVRKCVFMVALLVLILVAALVVVLVRWAARRQRNRRYGGRGHRWRRMM